MCEPGCSHCTTIYEPQPPQLDPPPWEKPRVIKFCPTCGHTPLYCTCNCTCKGPPFVPCGFNCKYPLTDERKAT